MTNSASRLDSRLLEIFLAVCDSGSMTAAARRLGVSQGAVSQQINRLETTLDLRVLERGNRQLKLTPAGRHLRFHARRVIAELYECEIAMRSFTGVRFPSISVAIIDTLAKNLMTTLVKTLEPIVEQIQIRTAVNYKQIEDLQNETVDIAITAYEFEEGNFDVYPIVNEPLVVLAPKGRVERSGTLDLQDLADNLPMIRFSNNKRPLRKLADRYLHMQGIAPHRSIETDQAASVLASVGDGQGWVITTPFMILDPFFEHEGIDVIALPDPVPVRRINLVSRIGDFGDLPSRLASNCRRHLQGEIDARLAPFLPPSAFPDVSG